MDRPAARAPVQAGGAPPEERELLRLLRQPSLPGETVEALCALGAVRRMRRVVPLLVRHPACPRRFAWEALLHLGWNDLLGVARDPRTAPATRRQAERKLVERIPQLAAGERRALARMATRAVLPALFDSRDTGCIEALLDNPQCTESEVLRLLAASSSSAAVATVARHRRWSALPAVLEAALRTELLPLGLALGILAGLGDRGLERLTAPGAVAARLQEAARLLLERRALSRQPSRGDA